MAFTNFFNITRHSKNLLNGHKHTQCSDTAMISTATSLVFTSRGFYTGGKITMIALLLISQSFLVETGI